MAFQYKRYRVGYNTPLRAILALFFHESNIMVVGAAGHGPPFFVFHGERVEIHKVVTGKVTNFFDIDALLSLFVVFSVCSDVLP